MATTVARPIVKRYDRIFFPSILALILATVFIGFSRTYYLAGMVRAPLPNVLIHVHGAVFTSWLLMLIVQTGLVSVKRVDLHRRLGLWGFGLACLMVAMGLLAATDSLRRGFAPAGSGLDPRTFYIVPIGDMVLFSLLIWWAYRERRNPAAHKRLIIIATVALLDAAVARWPFAFVQGGHVARDLCVYAFLVLMIGYDLLTMQKVHKATAWGSVLVIVIQQARVPLGMTGAWHAIADFILRRV